MSHVRIIPCLDVKDGRVVKGVQFVDLRDAGDPVAAAAAYDAAEADELCLLDITASRENRSTLHDIVRRTAENCFMPLTVGGGVRNPGDVVALLRSGADKVAINSAAVANPQLLRDASREVGAQCIIASIDARRVVDSSGNGDQNSRWEIFTHGGSRPTGISATEYAKMAEANGAGEILLTSMDRDGTKSGYDIELCRAVTSAVSVPVIASGGAGSVSDLVEVAKHTACTGVLAASILHFGECSVEDIKIALMDTGVATRPPRSRQIPTTQQRLS